MTLPEKLLTAWPPEKWQDVTVLVAVSGGADSVALLLALAEARAAGDGRLVVAHFNHHLRGAESDADQQFVEELARSLNLPAIAGHAEGGLQHAAAGEGLESAARSARYDFFTSAAGQFGARYIAIAHTADDQAETVLFNILRGTGLSGLAGIPRTRPLTDGATIIRPLLDVTRAEVLDYLTANDQPYREDSTNALTEFTRNRIRRELLPVLERDFNAHVRQSLLRLAAIAGQTSDYLNGEAEALFARAIRSIHGGVELQCALARKAHPALLRQLLSLIWQRQDWPLQDMSLAKWEQLAQLAVGESSAAVATLPGAIRAERTGEILQLTRHA